MVHPLKINQRLRQDQVTEVIDRQTIQSLAPEPIKADLYWVPEVFEE